MNGEIIKNSNGQWIIKYTYLSDDKQVISHDLPIHPYYKKYNWTIGDVVKFQYAKECNVHYPHICTCLDSKLFALPIEQPKSKYELWLFIITLVAFILMLSQAFGQGVTIMSGSGSKADVAYLKQCNVQNLRIMIKPLDRAKKFSITPETAFNMELNWALRIVDECNAQGIKPVVAFNDLSFDSITDEMPMFWADTNYLNKTYSYIDQIGAKFANKVYIYEFLSEPAIKFADTVISPPRLEEFYRNALAIIRKRDNKGLFMLTPGPYGLPTTYGKFLPFNFMDSNLIYNFHMYLPFNYTHQGLRGRPKGIEYPLPNFNADTILKRFKAVKKWSDNHGYKIYLGEFNVVRWSKNGTAYVQDVINAANLYGFEWCYFAYKPNFYAWNPFFDIANPTKNPSKYYLKNYGIDSQHWLMLIYYLQNGSNN